MISNLTNDVAYHRREANELASNVEAFLSKGGTIEVLEGPSFKPRERFEPPPSIKAPKPVAAKPEEVPVFVDKMTLRAIERAERQAIAAKDREKLVAQVKKLAETMCYSEVSQRTGLSRKMLYTMSTQHDFKFKPAPYRNGADKKRGVADEKHDANTIERINAFKEIGLSRNQAIDQLGVTFRTFNRLLAKFDIDYPKRTKGPAPAFFAKPAQQ